MGRILIFYKYIAIKKPSEEVAAQKKLCNQLELRGRIYIAPEGINGTVGGSFDATENYKVALRQHPLFFDMDIKESEGSAEHFPRLQVTAKKQAVNFGIDPSIISPQNSGIHVSPEEAHALIAENSQDLVVLDVRNDYEWKIGAFTNSVKAPIENFRDFPQYLDEHLDEFKNKRVIMVCTSGIRCEPATAYLKKKQVAKEVFHIKGGIQRYTEQYPDGYFRGKNYVFDGRISQKITDDILGQCDHCKNPNDDYTNCINAQCNKQIISCPECINVYENTCSTVCAQLVKSGKVKVRVIPRKIEIDTVNTRNH